MSSKALKVSFVLLQMSRQIIEFLEKFLKSKKNLHIKIQPSLNRYRIYVDIKKGKICSQFRFLTQFSFIGLFFHPVGGEGWGKGNGWRVLLFQPDATITLLGYMKKYGASNNISIFSHKQQQRILHKIKPSIFISSQNYTKSRTV